MTWGQLFRCSRNESIWLILVSLAMPTIDLCRGRFMTFWGLSQFTCYLLVITALILACVLVCMHSHWLRNVWRKR